MVMQHNASNHLMTTFNTKYAKKTHTTASPSPTTYTKRPAPLAPPQTRQELVINVNNSENLKLCHHQAPPSLFSASSTSTCSNQDKKLLSASTSASSSIISSKIKNKTRSTVSSSSVSSPSSGSSTSHESVVISSSPTSINQNKQFYNFSNPAFDASNVSAYFEDLNYEDGDHREMAIDCPETFVPEVKTKPVYPPKPLLTFSSVINKMIETGNEEITHKNKSFSSIKFIDEDTRSRLNLNDSPIKEELNSVKVSPSLGKQLFEKQKNENQFGLVNNCFEMEEVQVVKAFRAPTPSRPVVANLTCVTITDSISAELKQGVDTIDFRSIQSKAFENCIILSSPASVSSRASSNLEALDAKFELGEDNLFKVCNGDAEMIKSLVKTNEFKNTLELYNKLIKLNSIYDLKPVDSSASELVKDAMKFLKSKHQIESDTDQDSFTENTSELCSLLTKLDFKNLLNAHDKIGSQFEQKTLKQQSENRALMLEHHHHDNPNMTSSRTTINTIQEEVTEQRIEETTDLLSDEGRFLLNKAQHYCVDNLKLVNIEKSDAPLGATIRNRDGNIIISRIVIGGAAQQSGLLHEEDEILEINNIPVRGKTINDICELLCDLQGIVSFLIIPNMSYEPVANVELEKCENSKSKYAPNTLHIRALFNYIPEEDLYMPCKELGLGFNKGDVLHIISQDDEEWWQAYRDEDKDQSLAGLIPSQAFQERRFSQMQSIIGDSFMDRKKRDKGFCIRGTGMSKNTRRRILAGLNNQEEIVTYEEVTLYRPPVSRKRPIVLIGPHSIGRHELRKRLMQSYSSQFEVAVPHTTRAPRRDECDGRDYHFLPRHVFEADIKQGRFIEHGEYGKNLYGTSREAIKKVIDNSKICVLNLYPQALKALRCSDLMPYVVYIGPPNLIKLKELKSRQNENYRENDLLDIIDKGREIEESYGHYFDRIIRNADMDKTYGELYETIMRVQNEENWVPVNWLSK